MTQEARTILVCLAHGLKLDPFLYTARSWLILTRYRRRFKTILPIGVAKPLDRSQGGPGFNGEVPGIRPLI